MDTAVDTRLKVRVTVSAGLGNQLFVLATAKALSLKFNRKLEVFWSLTNLRFHFDNDFRLSLYSKFDIRCDTPEGRNITDEEHDLTNIMEDVIVGGYCQSSKYFDSYRDDILSGLYLSPTDINLIDTITGRIRAKNPGKRIIALQVRRTDYIEHEWTLPLSYYTDAMSMFPDCVFVITTDDVDWCKSNLPDNCEYLTCYSENSLQDYIQMYIMSKLDGMIMANSTFGWWIAYIGNFSTVVAPTPWFKSSPYNKDIYIDHWFKLQLKNELKE